MRGRWEEHHHDHTLIHHRHRWDVALEYLMFHFEPAALLSQQHLVPVLLASVEPPPVPWLGK
jgi:hypothetical protein